jgi:uncharacterized protein YhbP (UPF0306 family)
VNVDVRLPDDVLDYLREQHTVTLATTSKDGVPRASTFLYVNDGPTICFWTRTNSGSARNIEENSQVAFAIDEYSNDLRQTRGLRGVGKCEPLTGEDIARIADLFGQKFPDLSHGRTTSIVFFAITPAELEYIDNRESGASSQQEDFGAEFHARQL